jgi:hypothetical protein
MPKLVWEITGCWRINMKIYLNKNIREIHWSVYIGTSIFFILSYLALKEYKEDKFLFEKGDVAKAIVIAVPEDCNKLNKHNKYASVYIINQQRKESFEINKEICRSINLNDTILVRCTTAFNRILKYNSEITSPAKTDIIVSIISFLSGLLFLLFANDKNKFFNPHLAKYQ